MSLFRPGSFPSGESISYPQWRRFDGQATTQSIHTASTVIHADHDLNRARLEAAQLLEDASSEVEQVMEQARREGLAQAREQARAEAQAELDALKQQAVHDRDIARIQSEAALKSAEADARAVRAQAEAEAQTLRSRAQDEAANILEAARAQQEAKLDSARVALIDLAVAATVRMVQGHLALAPGAIVGMVAAGLQRLKDSACTVRISPDDLPLLEAQRATLERHLGSGLLQIQRDAGLTPGNFTVNSSQGFLDGRLDQEAGHLRNALQAALGGASL